MLTNCHLDKHIMLKMFPLHSLVKYLPIRLTGSMPTLEPGDKTSIKHSLIVGTLAVPARISIQLGPNWFSAYKQVVHF